jgi:Tfp pilus assembly protein PilW
MNCLPTPSAVKRSTSAWTLVEMIMAVGVGALILGMATTIYLFGLRTFGAMGNYTQMDGESRYAMDLMLRAIRGSTSLVGYNNTGSTQWLTVTSTNQSPVPTDTFTLNTTTGTLLWNHSIGSLTETKTLLTGCDTWGMNFYTRAPGTNYSFSPAADATTTKMIEMTWKTSRTNLITKFNTESMVTAQVIMRNKP